MKKVFIFLGSLVALVLLAAVLLPIIFKDDIRRAIDQELDNALNAKVYYDTDAFGVSLFKSFPDLTVSVGNFGIVGLAPFERDTLVAVKEFALTLDIMSVIRGSEIKILDVKLNEPKILVKVLADGTANYDIAKPSTEVEAPTTEEPASPLSIQIRQWSITNGQLIYDDLTLPTYVLLGGLNHTGSGDFALDIFDMVTNTTVDNLTVSYDGVEYITRKHLTADVTMEMDLANMKFTFKENKALLNDFAFGFAGWVSMPASDIDMDITYGGQDITLLSVLSLTPGAYEEYLDGVKASGTVNFDGYVRGTYNDTLMPRVVANFGIQNGRVEYADAPVPMEKIEVKAAFDYPSADLRETRFIMDKFVMTMGGEQFSASLIFKDLEDYFWDLKVNGKLDLEKLSKVIPFGEMTLRGVIDGTLNTSGRMSDLDAERYANLPTSGSVSVRDFYYESADLPQGFGISESVLSFNPESIELASFKGNAGRTDLSLSGKITDYLQYALGEDTKLKGTFDYYSGLVDANEWMTDTDTTASAEPSDSAALEVVRVPENIDFVLAARIDQLKYDTYDIRNFAGKLIIRDGAVRMEKVVFNLLDGTFEMTGAYESAMAYEKPIYDFDLKIKDLGIASAFQAFNTVQKLAPVAEKMTGKFSTDFRIGGSLGADMMPIYDDMHGAGLIQIASAALKDVKLLSAVSSVSKLNNDEGEVTLKDVLMAAEIKGGRLHIEPFDFKIGSRKATVGGSTGIDGTMDYTMGMLVPSGQVGDALNSAISSFAGISNAVGKDIQLNLGITGLYNDPKVQLLSANPAGSATESAKALVADKAREEYEKRKEAIAQEFNQKKDSVASQVKDVVDEKKAEAKEEVKEATDEAKDKAKDAVKDLLKKKKGGR